MSLSQSLPQKEKKLSNQKIKAMPMTIPAISSHAPLMNHTKTGISGQKAYTATRMIKAIIHRTPPRIGWKRMAAKREAVVKARPNKNAKMRINVTVPNMMRGM